MLGPFTGVEWWLFSKGRKNMLEMENVLFNLVDSFADEAGCRRG